MPDVIETLGQILAIRFIEGRHGAIADAIAAVLFNTAPLRKPNAVTDEHIAEAAVWVSQEAARIAELARRRAAR